MLRAGGEADMKAWLEMPVKQVMDVILEMPLAEMEYIRPHSHIL